MCIRDSPPAASQARAPGETAVRLPDAGGRIARDPFGYRRALRDAGVARLGARQRRDGSRTRNAIARPRARAIAGTANARLAPDSPASGAPRQAIRNRRESARPATPLGLRALG